MGVPPRPDHVRHRGAAFHRRRPGQVVHSPRCESGQATAPTRPVQTGPGTAVDVVHARRRSPPGVAKYGCGATVAALSTSSRNLREQSEVAKLVIVESPAKARTIGGYLGSDYVVESSIGHIRDLPNNAADTPAKIKDKPWGRLAVDVDNGFEPYYVVPRDKKSHIAKLKKLVKEADALYLATDEDREGEAIAWHLLDELKPPKGLPVHRMVFHEITKAAILAAVENPREINDDLVEAQEARRILDRLYGYEVSPGAVEEGHVRPLRRPGAVRRDPPGRRQGARADEVPRRVLLGHRRHLRRRHRPRPADVPRQALQRRRRPRRPRLRLRQHRRPQGQGRARPPLARRRRVAGHRPRRHDVRRPLGRVQALPPLAVRPLPHHHAAAGGQPQARHERERDDVGRAAALRERLHHLHAHRLHDALGRRGRCGPRPGARAVRRRVPARLAAVVRLEGQERPGGARGDPPGRRVVPYARPDRAVGRAVPPLRADLDAHRRLPDEGRRRQLGDDPHRRCRRRRPRRGLQLERSHDHVPRLPQGLRRGHRRRVEAQGRRRDPAAQPDGGRRGVRRDADPRGPRDEAARALHRGDPDQGARGPARSAARRRTPRSSAPSSTAATSTRRAPRWCRPGWRSR